MSTTNNTTEAPTATKDQTSTLQSAIDAVSGTVQSTLGSWTGSTADQQAGEARKADASTENELSHAAARAGPYTLGANGTVAKDSAERSDGQWNQAMGSGKEMVGTLLGSEQLRQAGAQQHADGQRQEAKGQMDDLGQGISDRVSGAVGGAVASLTGNTAEQAKRQEQHDRGKVLQRGVEAQLQSQVDAAQANEVKTALNEDGKTVDGKVGGQA